MRRGAIVVAASLAAVLVVVLASMWLKAQMTAAPPTLRVSAGDTPIPVLQGSYCWKTRFKGVCADTAGPLELLKSQGYTPVAVPQFSMLSWRFSKVPTDLTIHWWAYGNEFTEHLRPDSTGFSAMSVPGVYPIAIDASWSQGSASYFFEIETRRRE